MSNNNTINQRSNVDMYIDEMDERYKPAKVAIGGVIYYGLSIPDTLLNDMIQEIDAYKEAEGVRRTGVGKGPIRRGEGGVSGHAEVHNTKILLRRKPTSKDKTPSQDKTEKETLVKGKRLKVKETYVNDPEQVHVATLLSVDSERLRLERIKREQRMIDEEIEDNLDETLEALKTKKMKCVAEYENKEPQIPTDTQLVLDFEKTLIMEYLVNISKRRAFWSLNEDILKITILTTNTPYPSRKIWRIRAYTHQRPQRKQDQYVVSREDQYAVLEIVAAALGFYQRNNTNPSYQERRQSMEDTLIKFMSESTKIHEENSNLIKEIRASTDATERGFGSLPRSTKSNPIDQVNSISTTIKADTYPILRIGSSQYANGSYGQQFSEAYSEASIPRKEKDPRSFSLPCFINNVCFDNSLVDLGASVSVMPLSTYLNLGLGELAHNKETFELADRTVKYPKGIAENVLVGTGKFVFPVDFIIIDMPEDIKVPLILKRPFLSTTRAKIDVYKRKITLRVGEERIIFTSVKPASSLFKRVYVLSSREIMELDLEARLMGYILVLNRSLDPLFEDYIELNDLNEPFELRRNQGDDLMPTIEEGEVIEEFRTRDDELDTEIDDYPILENMDAYCDDGMGDVIFGEPFLREVGIKTRRFEEMITIYNDDDEVTYQMVQSHSRFKHHTNEQCNKIPPLPKVSDEDMNNEISHPYQKLKGFYRGVLNLGLDYIQDARTEEWLIRGHISVHEME
ncbi:hypothetical protein Tco_0111695 [Tanacetum coccineum]